MPTFPPCRRCATLQSPPRRDGKIRRAGCRAGGIARRAICGRALHPEGVPGLAKTLMISSLARCLSLSFTAFIHARPDAQRHHRHGGHAEDRRAQRAFKFLPGPIFANVILADEINRTTPKTQAAMLESMQERQVTVGGVRHALPRRSSSWRRRNPSSRKAPIPARGAAGRLMFKIYIGYPSYDEEYEIATRTTVEQDHRVDQVLDAQQILHWQNLVRRVPAGPAIIRHALDLVRRTRPAEPEARPSCASIGMGAPAPARLQFLVLGPRRGRLLRGRNHVSTEDVRAMLRRFCGIASSRTLRPRQRAIHRPDHRRPV